MWHVWWYPAGTVACGNLRINISDFCRYVFPMCNLSLEINLRAISRSFDLLSLHMLAKFASNLLLLYLSVCVLSCQLLTDCDRLSLAHNDCLGELGVVAPRNAPFIMFVLASPTFWRLEGLSRVLRLPNGGYILTIVLIYILSATFCGCLLLRFRF